MQDTKSEIDSDTSLARLVRENPARARVFQNRALDFCCGGDQTLAEACEDRAFDVDRVREELGEIDARSATDSTSDAPDSLGDLVDTIVEEHHEFLREELGPLGDLVERVEGAHGDAHPELHEVRESFEALAREIPVHLSEEEQILFPVVRRLDDPETDTVELATAVELLEGLEDDHDDTAAHLERIRDRTDDFTVPDDACPSYENMLERLERLEEDLHMHVHRENNVLFSAVRERMT